MGLSLRDNTTTSKTENKDTNDNKGVIKEEKKESSDKGGKTEPNKKIDAQVKEVNKTTTVDPNKKKNKLDSLF
jgi:hypothetical protein